MSEDERQQPDQERREAERQQRISERVRRREERQTAGRRRLRPGPGRVTSPWQFTPPSAQSQEEALDHEIDIIANAVRDQGPLAIDELRRLIGARYWGPGRFRPAIREAIDEHRIVSLGRNRVGPPPSEDA